MLWRILCLHFCVPVIVAMTCPGGWGMNPYHNSCIKLYTAKKNWFGARATCRAEGSTLTHVDSVDMLTLITDKKGAEPYAWVATNDLAEEGVYRGVGGQLMTYLPWKEGQPSDDLQGSPHSQNCVVVGSSNFHDKPCTSKTFAFVCEKWAQDLQTARFVKISLDFLQTSNLGFDYYDYFRQHTQTLKACAMECRKLRNICCAFSFSPSTKICTSLKFYDAGSTEILSDSDRVFIANSDISVFMMQG